MTRSAVYKYLSILFVFILFPLLGMLAVWQATQLGIGITPDSAVYLGVVHQLSQQQQLSIPFGSIQAEPLIHYPPLYPLLLWLTSPLASSPESCARGLQALLFGANIALVGLMLKKIARASHLAAILGSALMIGSIPMLEIHSNAWAEPIFIFLSLVGLLCLARHLERQDFRFYLAAAGAMGLAFLARYVGFALLMSGALGLIVLGRRSFWKNFLEAVGFIVLASLPMTLWMIRNMVLVGEPTDRRLIFHSITSQQVEGLLTTISSWVLPRDLAGAWGGALLVALAVLAAGIEIRHGRKGTTIPNESKWSTGGSLIRLLIIFWVCYGMTLLISLFWFDAYTPLDNRILSPVFVASLICLLGIGFVRLRLALSHGMAQGLLAALLVPFVLYSILTGMTWIQQAHAQGLGFSSKRWQRSELMQKLKQLPDGTPIYSNGADAIYVSIQKPARWLPRKLNATSQENNQALELEWLSMIREMQDHHGVVAFFYPLEWRTYLPSERELLSKLSMQYVAKSNEGFICFIPPSDKLNSEGTSLH